MKTKLDLLPRFSTDDADRAFNEWGANCGPGAIAAICGLTLDEVRGHMGDFESKGYTNPTLLYAALDSIGVRYQKLRPVAWPGYGLVRVVWEGPWAAPNVPARAWYRHTHWIGTAVVAGDRGIFDINCMNNGVGWVAFTAWSSNIAPFLARQEPKATGEWHIVNGVEVAPREETK
ncbi:MAG TPA: hypothetical protein VM537_01625 [Anaerolineae bacterium]|nr:hypothetical protein [Anaerolineae bacterium]